MKKLVVVFIFLLSILFVKGQEIKTDSTKSEQEKVFYRKILLIKPIPHWIWSTAISNINSLSNYKKNYGKVSSFGLGIGGDIKIHNYVKILIDVCGYTYKQQIAEEGTDVHHFIGTGGTINLPLGAKYGATTFAIRTGLKFTYPQHEKYRPWLGLAYGINIWSIRYMSWEENYDYAKISGTTFRPSIIAGLDIRINEKFGTFSVFFEAIAPAASYTIENLFGIGDYTQTGGMTFPTPRIGISLSDF